MQKTNKHTPDVARVGTGRKKDTALVAYEEEQKRLAQERDRALRRASLNRALLARYLSKDTEQTESDRIEADNDYRREQGKIEADYQAQAAKAREEHAKTLETLEKYYADRAHKDQDALYKDTVESIRNYEFSDAEALDQILSTLSPYLRKEQKEYLERLAEYYRRE